MSIHSANALCLWLWLFVLLTAVQAGAAVEHGPKQQQNSPPRQRQQQQPHAALLDLLDASNAVSLATYQSVHQYNHSLPLPLLKNGLVYTGSSARLRRVVSKLQHGERVHIGAVGSSITYGRGVERGTSDWFTLFGSWLQTAFPAARVTAHNGAVPLAQSEYLSACLEQHIDPLADLVFVELTAADGYLDTSVNNELAHAFERLMRQLLQLPNKPAVVVLNALNPGTVPNLQPPQQQQQDQQQRQQQQQQQQQGQTQNQQDQQLQGAPQKQQRQGLPFYHTIEDHFGVVAQYYELPWLSVRNAVWQGITNGWAGITPQDIFHTRNTTHHSHTQQHAQQHHQQQQKQQRQLQQQRIQLPSTQGHKYMADLAVGLLQQTYLQQLLRPLGPSDAAAADVVRMPMFTGNWQSHGRGCATGLDLRAVARDAHKDWYLVSEGSNEQPRWGFVSHTPSATLTLQLDTRSTGANRATAKMTTDEKVHLLQKHGMLAAAAKLQAAGAAATLPDVAAMTPGQGASIQGAGLQDGATGAVTQHRVKPIRKAYVRSERLVGANPHSALQLPEEARLEVGKTKTTTGVEVILPGQAGRRLQQQQQQQQQQLSSPEPQQQRQQLAGRGHNAADSSPGMQLEVGSGGSRQLTSTESPLVIPPPPDALYLKPNADDFEDGSNAATAGSSTTNSSSSSSDAADSAIGTSVFTGHSFQPQRSMVVMVGYLRSNGKMGRAKISCISGCSCKPVTVDGFHRHHHQRLATAKLYVTQSPECHIGVQVLPKTSSGHHKFKVTGVMLAHSVDYRTPGSEYAHQYFLHPELLTE